LPCGYIYDPGVQSPDTKYNDSINKKTFKSSALASRHVKIDISNARYVTSFKRTRTGHNADA